MWPRLPPGFPADRLLCLDRDAPVLIWIYDNAARWERDWLRALLPPGIEEFEDFHRYTHFAPRMVVVDNNLARKPMFYSLAQHMGSKVTLIHVGDGGLTDDRASYALCHRVWRAHWSPDFIGQPNHVRYLPLGYKTGFARLGDTPPAADRPHLWGFAGDADKTTRAAMLAAMPSLAPGRLHLIHGWDAPDSLPVADYRTLMESIVFAPCPTGFASPDSFRMAEALEAGCIPILERAGNGLDDYFHAALGPHPLPVIDDWSQAPALIVQLRSTDAIEPLRRRCIDWWRAYCAGIADRLRADIAAM